MGLAHKPCGQFQSFQFARFQFAKNRIEGLKSQNHCSFSLQDALCKLQSPRGWAQIFQIELSRAGRTPLSPARPAKNCGTPGAMRRVAAPTSDGSPKGKC